MSADPGLGKTTKLPLYLLANQRLSGKIIIIEPRRLASVSAAERASQNLGEKVGNRVGYRVRWDARFSAVTQLEFWTDGVFLNKIQEDPALTDISAILIDEFHERSLFMEFSLALALRAKALFRTDLKILLLSASLDGIPWDKLNLTYNKMEIQGERFPVEVFHMGSSEKKIPERLRDLLPELTKKTTGSILIFLPGKDWIYRSIQLVSETSIGSDFNLLPLQGEMSLAEQSKSIDLSSNGKRNLIFATNVAESSLTVEGVTCVVDSGMEKVLHFDPESGFTVLKRQFISQSSAKQRAGRAGRIAAGQVVKLYSKSDEDDFAKQRTPEILRTDLSQIILMSKSWGEDLETLPLLDRPSEKLLAEIKSLLTLLGALNEKGDLTPLGKQSLYLTLPPRLGLASLKLLNANGFTKEWIADHAIRFGESKVSKPNSPDNYAEIFNQFKKIESSGFSFGLDREGQKDLTEQEKASLFLLFAFPDRIGMQRENRDRFYKLANGKGAEIQAKDQVSQLPKFLIAIDLKGDSRSACILDFRPIEKDFLLKCFKNQIQKKTTFEILPKPDDVFELTEIESIQLFEISLSSHVTKSNRPFEPKLLEDFWNEQGKDWIEKEPKVKSLIIRFNLLKQFGILDEELTFDSLSKSIDHWLLPQYAGKRPPFNLKGISLLSAIESMLTYQSLQKLEKETPESLLLPSGNRAKLEYNENEVLLNVRLQEIFGWTESPKIAGGKYSVTLALLSPGYKLVQKTKDLAQFWKTTYFEVKKELRGRYPRHFWPDDPLTAIATARTKKVVRKP